MLATVPLVPIRTLLAISGVLRFFALPSLWFLGNNEKTEQVLLTRTKVVQNRHQPPDRKKQLKSKNIEF